MKKSVILIIAIIYVLPIILVGKLGMELFVPEQVKNIEKIECINEEYQAYNPENEKHQEWIKDGYSGRIYVNYLGYGTSITLKFKVTPEDATVTSLNYNYDMDQTLYTVTNNNDGTATVTFYDVTDASIEIKAADNKGVSIKIMIHADYF